MSCSLPGQRGGAVTGVDVNDNTVRSLAASRPTVVEPGLAELLEQSRSRMRFSSRYEAAIDQSDVCLLMVPTPSQPDGRFANTYVEAPLRAWLDGCLRLSRKDYHLFVLVSTVMSGSPCRH